MSTSSLSCPVCGNDNSSQAKCCMTCGKPLEDITSRQALLPPANPQRRRLLIESLVTGTALVAGAGMVYLASGDRAGTVYAFRLP